jgi:adenylosuccinate synthase
MPAVVIVGTQWGDEGKGKIVDYCSKDANLVVRYQGGTNAGHTIVLDEKVFKLRLVPSGVFYGNKVLIGSGVVVDPEILLQEINTLTQRGIDVDLVLSGKAHVTLPYHPILDGSWDKARGKGKIGTTKRGIGPTYTDKIARRGIRVYDLVNNTYEERVRWNVQLANKILQYVLEVEQRLDEKEILQQCSRWSKGLQGYVGNVSEVINEALEAKRNVLFEGAQATFLDIDHGTYPFVTSSNPIAGGACVGAGVGPTRIQKVLGVCKAYTTRVGKGPFPTELEDDIGVHLQETGREFGTVTGRPRRCGWLDLNMIRYAKLINGLTSLALTKLDVLNGLKQLRICVGYRWRGSHVTSLPIHDMGSCEPIYAEFEGWETLLDGEKICSEAKAYIAKIEEETGLPIDYISIGPKRVDTICRRSVWS